MERDLGRLSSLFGAARRLSPPERRAYLDAACGGDVALRDEVEDLLRAHDAAGESDRVDARLPDVPRVAAAFVDGASPASDDPPVVDGFRVLSRLAEGGMGTVYVAEQEKPRRRVALKVLRPEATSPEGRRRFEQEAEVLARLEHPGIARVLIHGTTSGPDEPRPFLAMEFIEGRPLTKAAAALDLKARVTLLAEVAEAVAHAHAKGVIHRDLKPDNILVQPDGRPKVVDFGVARLAGDAETRRTVAGSLVGTLAYMSPEQARGDAAAVDTRSDVYSLGVVAYEVLCERHPLGETLETFTELVRRIQDEVPPPPERLDPRLRGDLDQILRKALAKEPADRYAGASAFAEDLRRHLADEPIVARPPTGAYLLRRFLRRHKTLVGGSLLALALLATGLVVALGLAHSERQARVRADASAAAMEQAMADRSIELAALALREHDAESGARALEQVPEALRGWEWRHLAHEADQSAEREPLDAGPVAVAEARLGPGAVWQARFANLYRLVRGPEDVSARRVPPSTGWVWRALADAAGVPVAATQKGPAIRIEDEHGELRVEARLVSSRRVQALAFSPDGRRFVVGQDGVQSWCILTLFDAPGGERLWRARGNLLQTRALAFSPDGRVIASSSGWDTGVRLLDAADGKDLQVRIQGHTLPVGALAFSPDGRWLVTGSDDRTALVFDTTTGEVRARFVGHPSPVLAVAFSPDGTRVATGGRDGSVRVWNAATSEGERVLLGHRGAVRDLAFRGDGILVSLGDDGRRTWRLASDPTVLRAHLQTRDGRRYPYVYAARFSPDGTRLASAGWDHTVRIMDLAKGTVEQTVEPGIGPLMDVAWARDGRSVVAAKGSLVRWDLGAGRETARWSGTPNVNSVRLFGDGTRLITASGDGTVHIHGLEDLAPTATWKASGTGLARLEVSPQGDAFAVLAQDGEVQVRDLSNGTLRWKHGAHGRGEFGALAYSPNGSRIATGGPDGRVRVWDAATGEAVEVLDGHTEPVYSLAWLPDGSRLFSGDRRGRIRVFDPASGRTCLELRGHDDYVFCLDVAPDGETVASTSGDGTVRIWSTTRSASAPQR